MYKHSFTSTSVSEESYISFNCRSCQMLITVLWNDERRKNGDGSSKVINSGPFVKLLLTSFTKLKRKSNVNVRFFFPPPYFFLVMFVVLRLLRGNLSFVRRIHVRNTISGFTLVI